MREESFNVREYSIRVTCMKMTEVDDSAPGTRGSLKDKIRRLGVGILSQYQITNLYTTINLSLFLRHKYDLSIRTACRPYI